MQPCLPVLALALASVLVVGCSTRAPARSDAPPSTEKREAQNQARTATAAVLSRLYAAQPGARQAAQMGNHGHACLRAPGRGGGLS